MPRALWRTARCCSTAELDQDHRNRLLHEQDIVLPTSTAEVAAAVCYYYGLVPPYPHHGPVKIRVASRISGIPMKTAYRQVLDD